MRENRSLRFFFLYRKVSMVTSIEAKQETFRSRFESERKDGGRVSRNKPRSLGWGLLVFVVKSQRKLRLRRNQKRFDENSKENAKEDPFEAWQVAIASEDVISVAIASGREPRRVPLVFVVKSQRKLRLRRNEKHFEEDSKENAKEEPFEDLQVAT